jgi:murein L,D-transpeptidase YafK
MPRYARPFLLACAVSLTLVAQAAGDPRGERRYSDSGPEPMLAKVLVEIEGYRLDSALQLTEQLLRQYPNFRLGHLIKGDLLLARSRPLATFGDAPNAPQDKLAELREEAVARLRGYREKPPVDYVPRYLLQMPPDQRHAVVVDTRKSRLYLYANDNGRPRFVADYYITQGKEGSEKAKEGDKKTPIGVYHVTGTLPKAKLTDFYGSGAFPINYPNEWDKRAGRTGHGIWLHGTPSDTYSRPPKASDGCVVLSNQDLDALATILQPGLTPVIIGKDIEWLSFDDWQRERESLRRQMEQWRTDWESRDINRFLRHYSKRRFAAEGQDFARFARTKGQINASKSWVKIRVDDVSMFRNPGKDDFVVVTFDQRYESNNLKNQSKKRQYWIREDGAWKIVYEGTA